MKGRLAGSQSNAQGNIYKFHFLIRKSADVISEPGFGEACQIVTMNGARHLCRVVLQALISANHNLGGNTMIFGINRCTDNRGKLVVVNKTLPGNYKKNSVVSKVLPCAAINPVELTAFHKSGSLFSKISTWYKSTSSASRLSSSAWIEYNSLSRASSSAVSVTLKVLKDLEGVAIGAGVNATMVLPTGICIGTSSVIRRFAGISIVCVIVILRRI